ncbi:MAG: type II toxin-antitoxin system prevent-host-death family antitoxin [Myxococcota bacterium]|nr:type II toxin-antitoxin system prevent-host-death family antitoxin [Myxococcota bacterium]
MKRIAAGKFKATCLKLMDRVAATGEAVEITKRGKPLARLVPVQAAEAPRSIFGAAAHRILFLAEDEEILSTGEIWDAAL